MKNHQIMPVQALIEDKTIRNEYAMKDYHNVLGDTWVVQSALYLSARILTFDKRLKSMAAYAGAECFSLVP